MATPTTRCAAAAVLAAAALLSGCAGLEEDDVAQVAGAFEDPATAPADRCALLAPTTRDALESDGSAPCVQAIEQVPLPGGAVEAVEVWGGEAQVRLGGDTVFLTETPAGWRVTAAVCQPRGELPYDCEVEGA
ncbi:hypothetical protein [Geodermatophilus sp. DSM 45219]|uniref:hypothetical protein n=1 Tax=Geodermatophilus sp. DSM 45219 TaxID=1881103 RepID=UPI000883F638|nr:hypothetical protein [Geodermatophilus sp. DSM 45219]SDN39751.1 hypothetical protein SAMN05428965_0215 [Geodermatophilus sp. DSM 45219]